MTFPRAFLSHSSAQKSFVDPVAAELGRQFCVFDKSHFHAGDDLANIIAQQLTDSSLFVLFASTEAIASNWVQFEINKAAEKALRDNHRRVLVLILDPTVDVHHLPPWLHKSVIRRATAPKPAARIIRGMIDEIMRARATDTFIGRAKEQDKIQAALLPIDTLNVPRTVALSGLTGIGRRTLAARMARDLLGLRRLLPIRVSSGDEAREVVASLASEVEPYSTPEGIRELIEQTSRLSESDLSSKFVEYTLAAQANGDLVTLIDEGGLLDSDARIGRSHETLVKAVAATKNAYLALILTRRLATGSEAEAIPSVRIDPFSSEEMRRLLVSLAGRHGVRITSAEITELLEYLGGYPPAANHAIQLMLSYGTTAVIADKARLVDFRATYFVAYLRERQPLWEQNESILKLLCAYSPLPLQVIGESLRATPESLTKSIQSLIDASLVTPIDGGQFEIAQPVADAIRRLADLSSVAHDAVAKSLENYLENAEDSDRRLELSRALYRANQYSGGASKWAVRFASDLVRLTREYYYQREYGRAIQYGREALKHAHENMEVREYLARALIKDELFDDALSEIEAIRRMGEGRTAAFLTGFLERARERPDQAIVHYLSAVEQGRSGVAIHRELAYCYFETGKLDRAKQHLDIARKSEAANRFIIDLLVQIATHQNDESAARENLRALSALDGPTFYKHRLSTVELAFGNKEAALEAATEAVAGGRATLPFLTQLAKCQIELAQFGDGVETVDRIDKLFPKTHVDIRKGLRCKLEIARKHFAEALALSAKLRNPNKPVHKILRRDAIEGALRYLTLHDNERRALTTELELLRASLQGVDGSRVWAISESDT